MVRNRKAVSTAAIRQVTQSTPVEPLYVSVMDAEKITSVSRWTWRHYCYQGLLDYCKVGGRLLIPLTELQRLLEEGTRFRVRVPGKTFNQLAEQFTFKKVNTARKEAEG